MLGLQRALCACMYAGSCQQCATAKGSYPSQETSIPQLAQCMRCTICMGFALACNTRTRLHHWNRSLAAQQLVIASAAAAKSRCLSSVHMAAFRYVFPILEAVLRLGSHMQLHNVTAALRTPAHPPNVLHRADHCLLVCRVTTA